MDMLDDTVALRAFVDAGVFAQFMRVNSDGFRFGTANGAVRAFALGCLHIASPRIGREHQALSFAENQPAMVGIVPPK